ncbi:MAG: DNA cytosine methyltransferase [Rubripirellula sp.]
MKPPEENTAPNTSSEVTGDRCIVDLFCGIGGVAQAAANLSQIAGESFSVTQAIDIDRRVHEIYQLNHQVTPTCKTLESIREIATADLWWLSPPCQPYTARGEGLADHDPRSAALANLIVQIERLTPPTIALENVPQFGGSVHHRRLLEVLQSKGYSVRSDVLCPTQFGVPMRRRRFYLRASRVVEVDVIHFNRNPKPLASFVNEGDWNDTNLLVSDDHRNRYAKAMDLVDPATRNATTACFTSAYGKSPVQAGSYLHCSERDQVRWFSPREIGRLMGFGDKFLWPTEIDRRVRYQLLGNSLSVDVVEAVLQSITAPKQRLASD